MWSWWVCYYPIENRFLRLQWDMKVLVRGPFAFFCVYSTSLFVRSQRISNNLQQTHISNDSKGFVISGEHMHVNTLYIYDEESGSLVNRALDRAWMESAFLNESNVLLSMCLPCMPPPSLSISQSIHFLRIYFRPIPHKSLAYPPFSMWMETGK